MSSYPSIATQRGRYSSSVRKRPSLKYSNFTLRKVRLYLIDLVDTLISVHVTLVREEMSVKIDLIPRQ